MPDDKVNVNDWGGIGANDPILNNGPTGFGDSVAQSRRSTAQKTVPAEPEVVATESFVNQGQTSTAYQTGAGMDNLYTPSAPEAPVVSNQTSTAWPGTQVSAPAQTFSGGASISQETLKKESRVSTAAGTVPTQPSESSHTNTTVAAVVDIVKTATNTAAGAMKTLTGKLGIHQQQKQQPKAAWVPRSERMASAQVATHTEAPKFFESSLWRRLVAAGIAVAVVIVVFSVAAIFKRPARGPVYLRDEYRRDEVALDQGNHVQTAGVCQPVPEATVAAIVDDFVSTLESDVYESKTVDEQMRADFDFFARYSLWTNAQHCFYLEYCYNDFAQNTPFMLGFARRVFSSEFLGEVKKVDNQSAMRQPANQLRERVQKYFGVDDVDVSKFPAESGDVYDASDDSFMLSLDEGKDGPYHYDLVAVYEHPALGQRVFVADAVFSGKCTLRVNEDKCTCPTARYYLVQDVDPVSGERVFGREYVQIIGKMEKA